MTIEGNDLLELIPQRYPIVMIDKLIFADTKMVISNFTITEDCIFCEDGELSESGMIENIAQTAAAGFGYICKNENKEVPLGFIASIKDLTIINYPIIGVELTTKTEIINEVLDITIILGTISIKNDLIAKCEMRIFIKPEQLE